MTAAIFVRTDRFRFTAVLAAIALFSAPGHAQSTGKIKKMEDKLAAAGFEAKPATTPDLQQMMARLPADKLTQRTIGDDVVYVYPDPKLCNCIYVGDQAAYGALRKAEADAKLADENFQTSQNYSDASWQWNAWGPWGPRWSRFGFGGWTGW